MKLTARVGWPRGIDLSTGITASKSDSLLWLEVRTLQCMVPDYTSFMNEYSTEDFYSTSPLHASLIYTLSGVLSLL